MNHSRMTLAITAIIAAAALATVALAVPQQAMAYRHSHHHDNSIKVDQQVNQENQCTGQSPEVTWLETTPPGSTVCVNQGNNNAEIHR
jgi:hypothetical protein